MKKDGMIFNRNEIHLNILKRDGFRSKVKKLIPMKLQFIGTMYRLLFDWALHELNLSIDHGQLVNSNIPGKYLKESKTEVNPLSSYRRTRGQVSNISLSD